MNDPIAVSIITPCYNAAPFLAATIDSALSQTLTPLEMIVIDDGSTDTSAEIARSFNSIVRVITQPNQGESVARNRGIAEARGTHALFLDADDLLAPEALQHAVTALRDVPHGVALMGSAKFKDDPSTLFDVDEPQTEFLPLIIEANFGPPHSWVAPLDVVRRAGCFAEHLRWFEDWDLWWRVAVLGPPLVPVRYVGALYRQHSRSQLATTKIADRTRGHAMLMERMATAFLEQPQLIERYGDRLFWSCWTAVRRAHMHGVPWSELRGLGQRMQEILRRGPRHLRQSWTARAIALLGTRTTVQLNAMVAGPKAAAGNSTPR